MNNLYIFDCEVFAHDWLIVFKNKETRQYTVIWNDNDAVIEFMASKPLVAGFNNKHYDQFIVKAIMQGCSPEEVKSVNDYIILEGGNAWDIPFIRQAPRFNQYDLMDDCQKGLSLKAIEAHLGMNIEETTVDFNISRHLSDDEKQRTEFYCKCDVDATDNLCDLRQDYLNNKIRLGQECGLSAEEALYMTNATLTSKYLKAVKPEKPWDDERNYKFPENLKFEYIPEEVIKFFERIHDMNIPSKKLFNSKIGITVGNCPATIAFGGIHGAIPCYKEVVEV